MKNALHSAGRLLFAGLLVCTLAHPDRVQAQFASIEDQLKSSGEGVGRFRGGVYGALGWGFGSKAQGPGGVSTRPSGLHFELGLYGLFNPIRDFADVETGIAVTGITPSSSSSQSGAAAYKSGYIAGLAYAGPVFRLGKGGNSLALGAQYQFGSKVLKESGDALLASYPATMKPSLGVYGEYQYQGGTGKAIYYTRIAANKYDITFKGAPAALNESGKGGTMLTLGLGVKY